MTRHNALLDAPSASIPALLRQVRFLLLAAVCTAAHVFAGQLIVKWDDNSKNETGFRIERSVAGKAFVEIATVAANITQYVDATVAPSTTYSYRVRAYNAFTTSGYSNIAAITTAAAGAVKATALSNATAPSTGKLANLSVRASSGQSDQPLIVGFVIKEAAKSVLVRAIGPGLAPFTTAPTMKNPALAIHIADVPILENNNWGGTDLLKSLFSKLGAFPLLDTNRDAAVLSSLSAQGYTMLVKGDGPGLAMAEIYDADIAENPAGRLVNLSARAHTGSGDAVLIAGFVVSGSGPIRVLIRAVGPTLANYGVTSTLADPQLDLFRGTDLVAHNNDWGGDAELNSAFVEAGAFRLPDARSRDAALVTTLLPGAYTAIVSGVGGTTGVALVEVYQLP